MSAWKESKTFARLPSVVCTSECAIYARPLPGLLPSQERKIVTAENQIIPYSAANGTRRRADRNGGRDCLGRTQDVDALGPRC